MAERWQRDLLQNVIPFWEKHSIDHAHGGYFTALDADGSLLDDSKYTWLQCRAVYMWSKLHNEFHDGADGLGADAQNWFEFAKAGAAFLKNLKAADGRLHFAVSRDGRTPLHYQRKPFGAMFYCLAAIEFARALTIQADSEMAIRRQDSHPAEVDCLRKQAEYWSTEAVEYFERFRGWLDHPEEIGGQPRGPGSDDASNLAAVMCLAGLSEALLSARPASERARWLGYVADAQTQVVKHFDPIAEVLRENASATTGVSDATPASRLFNPGHSIEVAWFLLHLNELRPDEALRTMALNVLEHSLRLGWDEEHGGGLLYMLDVCGRPMTDCTVTSEHKLWWPMAEALYALMLAIELTDDEARWLPWLQRVHTFIFTRLCDAAGGGEWYGYLRRDGSVFNACKGGNYKGFFHVPRGLLMAFRSAERHLSKHSTSLELKAAANGSGARTPFSQAAAAQASYGSQAMQQALQQASGQPGRALSCMRPRAMVLDRAEPAAAIASMLQSVGFEVTQTGTAAAALAALHETRARREPAHDTPPSERLYQLVVCSLGVTEAQSCWPVLAALHALRHDGAASHVAFVIVLSRTAAADVRLRLRLFGSGAKMVSASLPAVEAAARQIADGHSSGGSYTCPACMVAGFSAEALSVHVALAHSAEPNVRVEACPVCGGAPSRPLSVHLNHFHGPPRLREPPPPPFAAFAWVVCRRADGRFLLVNEPAGLCAPGVPGYWLPAGRLDRGETFVEAAVRECLEEAGVRVTVTGVLRFSFGNGGVPRVVLMAAPADESEVEPKSVPDFESVGALWVAAEELSALTPDDYRSPDPAELFPRVASGALPAQTLHTEAWVAFEALLRRLTSRELRRGDDSGAEVQVAWEALADAYPTACPRPPAKRPLAEEGGPLAAASLGHLRAAGGGRSPFGFLFCVNAD